MTSYTYILLRGEYLEERQQDLSVSQVQEQVLHQRLVVLQHTHFLYKPVTNF